MPFLCWLGFHQWGVAKNKELHPDGSVPWYCARCGKVK